MYVSPVLSTTNFGYAKSLTKANKLINRSSLQKVSSLSDLRGYAEKEEAKNWVAAYSVGNIAAETALAQTGKLDKPLLYGMGVVMANHILNGIYDLKLSKNTVKTIGVGITEHKIDPNVFKRFANIVVWMPLCDSIINAKIASSITTMLGDALIETAEFMDEQRQKGKTMDEIMGKLRKLRNKRE